MSMTVTINDHVLFLKIEGPGLTASKICMDKVATSHALQNVW